jgi:hypothetical protein
VAAAEPPKAAKKAPASATRSALSAVEALLIVAVFAAAAYVAYRERLYAIEKYGRVIHEFDREHRPGSPRTCACARLRALALARSRSAPRKVPSSKSCLPRRSPPHPPTLLASPPPPARPVFPAPSLHSVV